MTKRIINTRHIKLPTSTKTELINNMFANDNSNLTRYFSDRMKEVATKLLNDIGVYNIVTKNYWTKRELFFETPTLLINPYINDVSNSFSRTLATLIQTKFRPISGWDNNMANNKVYAPLDNTVRRISYDGAVIADYYETRKVLIVYFNLFIKAQSASMLYAVCTFLKEVITGKGKVSKKMSSEELEKINRKNFVDAFVKRISERKRRVIGNITELKKKIDYWNKSIIKGYQDINLSEQEIKALENFNNKGEKVLLEELDKIKNLQFVKEVVLGMQGISVDIGKITLKDVYIGDFNILIKPDEVIIKNKHMMNKGDDHPHILNGKPCLGTFNKGVNKLLSTFELSRLITVMVQFLNTYNSNSTYTDLSKWRSFRKNEKKFDKEGNLLNKLQEVKNDKPKNKS